MSERKLIFCLLCGTLEDAIDLMEAGKPEAAKALLERTLVQARRYVREEEKLQTSYVDPIKF